MTYSSAVPSASTSFSSVSNTRTTVPTRNTPPDAFHLPPELFRAVLDSVDHPVVLVAQDGQVLFQNAAAFRANAESFAHPPTAIWYQVGGNMHGCALHVGALEPATAPSVATVCAKAWSLTPRQGQVLELVVEGHSNKTIAQALSCSTKTVELHVSAILAKTNSVSRTGLVGLAWRQFVMRHHPVETPARRVA